MTVQEVKAVLNDAREAGSKYFRARDKHRRYENRLTNGKTVRYNSTGAEYERNGNSVEGFLCETADYDIEADKCKAELSGPYCAAGRLIYLVKDERKRQVLNLRYLYCKSWGEIAMAMKTNDRKVQKLHGYALKEIARNYSKKY